MPKVKGITIELDMNTNNLSAKLKAIAKYAEALANELDAIDAAKYTNYLVKHEPMAEGRD